MQEVNLFLLGNADLYPAVPYMPPPAYLGQGRKAFQVKDKKLCNQAMQDPKWPASRDPTSNWATQETRAWALEITDPEGAGRCVSLGTCLFTRLFDTRRWC